MKTISEFYASVRQDPILTGALGMVLGSLILCISSKVLNKVPVIDINSQDTDLLRAYAEIDAYSKGKLTNKPLGRSAIVMSKNDLWSFLRLMCHILCRRYVSDRVQKNRLMRGFPAFPAVPVL